MIRFNTIHDSSSCKQAARMSNQPCESVWKGTLKLNSSYLDASQGTELTLRLELAHYRLTGNMKLAFQKNVIKCEVC